MEKIDCVWVPMKKDIRTGKLTHFTRIGFINKENCDQWIRENTLEQWNVLSIRFNIQG